MQALQNSINDLNQIVVEAERGRLAGLLKDDRLTSSVVVEAESPVAIVRQTTG
jgi:hypothetical protein